MLKRLNTPIKRVGFLLALSGPLMIAIAFSGFLDVYGGRPFEAFAERFMEGPFRAYRSWGQESRGWAALLAWVGFLTTVVGAVLAFAYDSTVGRLIYWVRTGE